MTIQEAMQLAVQHQQAGRLAEAEQLYRRVLTEQPNHADALHLLGVLAARAGRASAGLELIGRAIAINPGVEEYHADIGECYRRMGKLDEAVASFRRAVGLNPNHADGHYNLGNILCARGLRDEAIVAYGRAIQLRPDHAAAHYNLATTLRDVGRFEEAITAFAGAIRVKPDFAAAHNSLGAACTEKGELDQAIASFQRALALQPNYAEAHNNLGAVWTKKGRLDEAVACCQRALSFKPDFPEAHYNLGNAFMKQGQLTEAIACFQRAITLKPDYAEAHNNVGLVWANKQQPEQAILCYQRALALQPENAGTHCNLGDAFSKSGRLDEAVACCRRALELRDDYAEAYSNLGNVLSEMGRHEEALACYRRALELNPALIMTYDNLLGMLPYQANIDSQSLFKEHQAWNRQYAEPVKDSIQPCSNGRSPERRLRIGYVSPDLREHVVGWNLLPLLREHDTNNFQVLCYFNHRHADGFTARLRLHADQWRDIVDLNDEQVAELIRQDGIDILVDLSLHTAGNRLLVFARKPAPVQVSYLGYCGTTGMDAIDYRFSDPYLDPPGEAEFYSEQTVRLPQTYWCYEPGGPTPEVTPPPALTAGHITFGCMNKFAKVSWAAQDLWVQIMAGVPRSRLIIRAAAGGYLDAVRQRFTGTGIAADRLEFVGKQPWAEYLQTYHRIDIGLDPFPYGGGITTCDSLWMGAPVVSLSGLTAVGRGGRSILSNIGLPDLIAYTPDEYVRVATELANSIGRLTELRSSLRDRMRKSPLMDAPRFAGAVESAYREMWRRWCQSQ